MSGNQVRQIMLKVLVCVHVCGKVCVCVCVWETGKRCFCQVCGSNLVGCAGMGYVQVI